MQRLARLVAPPFSVYPIVNYQYLSLTSLADSKVMCFAGENFDPIVNKHIEATLSTTPSAVRKRQVAPLAAMSDETFRRLALILNFVIEDKLVDSKRGLAVAAIHQMPGILDLHGEGPDKYTQDQLQTYLLLRARDSFVIHWGALADLYNESTDDQKDAILSLFSETLNRSLKMLMSYRQNVLIPDMPEPACETQVHGGLTYSFSYLTQEWLREDSMQNRFNVEARIVQSSEFIAATPTLEQAIGYAIAYIQRENDTYNGLPFFDRIAIEFDGELVAVARIEKSNYESADSGRKLKWNDSTFPNELFPKKTFLAAAQKAEADFDLQWTKVHRLEEELGL